MRTYVAATDTIPVCMQAITIHPPISLCFRYSIRHMRVFERLLLASLLHLTRSAESFRIICLLRHYNTLSHIRQGNNA